MATTVSLVASIVELAALVRVIKVAYQAINYGSHVTQQLEQVEREFDTIEATLKDGRVSQEAQAALRPTLDSIRDALGRIPQRPTRPLRLTATASTAATGARPASSANTSLVISSSSARYWAATFKFKAATAFYGVWHGHSIARQLKRVLDELKLFSLQITCVSIVLPKTSASGRSRTPGALLPSVSIGLERADIVLSQIKPPAHAPLPQVSTVNTSPSSSSSSSTRWLRVVGLLGQGGVGKSALLSRLLVEVWDSFHAIAYAKLDTDEPCNSTLTQLQANLLMQLGGPYRKFFDVDQGKHELKARLKVLQDEGKSVCLAIDKVWKQRVLKDLLPDKLATHLPKLNLCIIITSREKRVVGWLSRHCEVLDPSEALSFEPQVLMATASRGLLFEEANSQPSNPVKQDEGVLIDRIFPYCGGLPLALIKTGEQFADERRPVCWEDWMSGMHPDIPGVKVSGIDHILELSYKLLSPGAQEALQDIGDFLLERHLDEVESIVGSMEVNDLRNLHLICDHQLVNVGTHEQSSAVRMHNLIRKLVALKQGSANGIKWDRGRRWPTSLLSSGKICGIKFLSLDMARNEDFGPLRCLHIENSCFEYLKKLKVLELSGSFTCHSPLLLPYSLRQLKLQHNEYLTEIEFPGNLRHLELSECTAFTELHVSLYMCKCLISLCIIGSPRLRGFQTRSQWKYLRKLRVERCPNVTNLPEDLESLQRLTLRDCERIQDVPMCYKHKLDPHRQVEIERCPQCKFPSSSSPVSFQPALLQGSTPAGNPRAPHHEPISTRVACSSSENLRFEGELDVCKSLPNERLAILETMTLRYCQDAAAAGIVLVKGPALRKLTLKDCNWLEFGQLLSPEEPGPQLMTEKARPPSTLPNLRKLKLKYNQQLKVLPDRLCYLSSLVVLSLEGCTQLQRLPENIGSLSMLKKLKVDGCDSQLVDLPSGICTLRFLEKLDLTRCSKLKALPYEMHYMTGLRELLLKSCTSLEKLPDTICQLGLLSSLILADCSKLVELPKDMGDLSGLRKLSLRGCSSLTSLPPSLSLLADSFLLLELMGCSVPRHDIPLELLRVSS